MYTVVTVTKKEYINQLFDHSYESAIDFSMALIFWKLSELRLSASKTFILSLLSLSSSLTNSSSKLRADPSGIGSER